jgi:hypothetical protein
MLIAYPSSLADHLIDVSSISLSYVVFSFVVVLVSVSVSVDQVQNSLI